MQGFFSFRKRPAPIIVPPVPTPTTKASAWRDRKFIRHLELTFEAERPPPHQIVQQELLMAAEERGEYF